MDWGNWELSFGFGSSVRGLRLSRGITTRWLFLKRLRNAVSFVVCCVTFSFSLCLFDSSYLLLTISPWVNPLSLLFVNLSWSLSSSLLRLLTSCLLSCFAPHYAAWYIVKLVHPFLRLLTSSSLSDLATVCCAKFSFKGGIRRTLSFFRNLFLICWISWVLCWSVSSFILWISRALCFNVCSVISCVLSFPVSLLLFRGDSLIFLPPCRGQTPWLLTGSVTSSLIAAGTMTSSWMWPSS